MGADRKKIANLMGEVFNDDVAKAELSMEEAGKLTQAMLCKAIDPDVSDEDALEVVKRGRALVAAIAEQDGTVKKAEGSDEEVTVYSVEKALVEALIEDVKDVKVTGSWGSNIDALKKRFEKTEDTDDNTDDKGDNTDTDTDDKGGDENRDDTNKNAGDDSNEDDVWGRAYDLNTKPAEDEDWGKDPKSIRD